MCVLKGPPQQSCGIRMLRLSPIKAASGNHSKACMMHTNISAFSSYTKTVWHTLLTQDSGQQPNKQTKLYIISPTVNKSIHSVRMRAKICPKTPALPSTLLLYDAARALVCSWSALSVPSSSPTCAAQERSGPASVSPHQPGAPVRQEPMHYSPAAGL